MKVALTIMPERVILTTLTASDDADTSPNQMLDVPEGATFGRIPYERLRAMGTGIHELSSFGDCLLHLPARPAKRRNRRRRSMVVSAITTANALGGLAMYALWETSAAPEQLDRVAKLFGGLNGKWVVGGVLGLVAVVTMLWGLKTFFSDSALIRQKRWAIQSIIDGLREATGRITISDRSSRRFVWLGHQADRFVLLLPLDQLTLAEERRARELLGSPERAEPDGGDLQYTPASVFVVRLDYDIPRTITTTLDVFLRVFKLDPRFDLMSHQHTTFSDEEPPDTPPVDLADGEQLVPVPSGDIHD